MSALSQQMNMNNFLSLLLGASLVAANSSPTNDAVSHTASADFPSGVTTFTLPNEHIPPDTTTLASFNYSYENGLGGEVASFVKEKAKYGEGKILNVTGLLVHITSAINGNDHTGCEKFWNGTNGGALPTYDVPWIALIKRGRCNFEDKVKHAYWYRAIGVIIYNDKDAQTLDKMKILDKERNITAVFTFKYKGEELAKLVEEGHNVVLSIIEGNTHTRTITNINRTSVLFVSISFIVLMIISLVWLVFYYVQRFRYLQTKDKQSRRLCNVAKRIIAKIPTKSIKADDKEIDNDCCAICIEPYKVTDVIRVLPCRHEFHKACIDPWLLEHRTCPMCKMDILKHYGFVVGSAAKPSSSSQNQTNPIIVDLYNATSTPPNTSTINSNSSSTSTSSSTISNGTVSTDSSISPQLLHDNLVAQSNNVDDNVMIININNHLDISLDSSATSSDQSLSESRRITDV